MRILLISASVYRTRTFRSNQKMMRSANCKDKEFENRKYFVRTLEDVTYVMKTEGTIFIFEWMFVLYGSFKINEIEYRNC